MAMLTRFLSLFIRVLESLLYLNIYTRLSISDVQTGVDFSVQFHIIFNAHLYERLRANTVFWSKYIWVCVRVCLQPYITLTIHFDLLEQKL